MYILEELALEDNNVFELLDQELGLEDSILDKLGDEILHIFRRLYNMFTGKTGFLDDYKSLKKDEAKWNDAAVVARNCQYCADLLKACDKVLSNDFFTSRSLGRFSIDGIGISWLIGKFNNADSIAKAKELKPKLKSAYDDMSKQLDKLIKGHNW